MNKRQTGTEYELIASEYLEEKGYEIIERNYRCRQGEIDLIAKDGTYLVFIEVKYRKNAAMGMAEEAVTLKKQKVIRSVARYYLLTKHQAAGIPCRFDVVGITGTMINLIQNAF